MSSILPLQLRPSRLSQLVGQKALVEAIRAQMGKRPPRAFLLHGGTGCGKTTIARIMAAAMQCPHQTLWGDPCDECQAAYGRFGIMEVNASEINGVDEIGKIVEVSRYLPLPPSLKQVIILDEAQRISTSAQNLLLKPFEDAPEHVVWIICTTEPSKILPTLRRRCMSYHIKNLGFDDRKKLVLRSAKKIGLARPTRALVEAINEHHIASPALILMALEKYAAGESSAASVLGFDTSSVNSLSICRAVASGSWKDLRTAMGEATSDEARFIRASVLGYLKGMLVKEPSAPKRGKIARAMKELAGPAPLEDGILLSWLWGVLTEVAAIFAPGSR